MFDKVLIANRGEIALRIQRACRQMGLRTVAVYSEADAKASYLRTADQAVCIGPATPALSYLNQSAILLAAELTGAQAIHPGYGFLSENADFAGAVQEAGLVFVGPSPSTIRTMGDKVAAKRAMLLARVPCVPGPDVALSGNPAQALALAEQMGYPVIIKAAGGGGGRGMRVVYQAGELTQAIAVTSEEARRAFGNPALYLEKYLEHPRHIEIQVLCDAYGHAVWLGSRDCSMQRRNQKVIEEAPASGIPAAMISQLGERCVQACLSMAYLGAGTFEFLYQNEKFYFIEMNTRLQVEHTVTELTTGIDIVEQQLRIARREPLSFSQADIIERGYAMECRINAEDPQTFIPSPGRITRWEMPGGVGVRVDSHVQADEVISPYYDSMLGKLITHGTTRAQAMARMQTALNDMVVQGIRTNISLHQELLQDPGFIAGGMDNHHLERLLTARQAP
jgi:acetyl-CoA carboxylase biotin carboxylase subunit